MVQILTQNSLTVDLNDITGTILLKSASSRNFRQVILAQHVQLFIIYQTCNANINGSTYLLYIYILNQLGFPYEKIPIN